MPDLVPVRRAILSVSDKTGLVDFGARLARAGVELVSTGGTARALREAGLAVRDVAELTGYPEMMDGRVKTLHPGVHGGILADRSKPDHVDALSAQGIGAIDLVIVNLYPFEATVASGADEPTTVENIDIGGPAMIRAAAKNHAHVGVVVDVEDYGPVADEIERTGGLGHATRRRLAADAFARTGAYDAAISTWFASRLGDKAPRRATLAGDRAQVLRYGENPHQTAGFYHSGPPRPGVATARQVQGKELSYNNLNDTNAAFELVAEFDSGRPAVAIIKHANPCGVAVGDDLAAAHAAALRCDPVSAFGGVIAVNRTLDAVAAEAIVKVFTEVVIAPDADEGALEVFSRKKNLRLLLAGGLPDPAAPGVVVTPVAGGFLRQSRDAARVGPQDLKVVTKRAPTDDEVRDLVFAFRVAKHVKSNAIVYAREEATVGIGAGQMSRLDSSRIAARKAEDAAVEAGLDHPLTEGSVVASDAFFPFADGMMAAVAAGARAVIQPGGSIRDDEVIAAADAAGVAMVFTGVRHFRH
ncbi:MAG: bifunctional phosphoribosylaminoimidazolecarboxamide formyltransferase/IMP cyclohydrolase [Alphaproteobacteria bacterium]|nr:bifunctional phosphoribosylaminoimidazolecarboxamide formyltransferase/IMP cyclohydrolase [Alphaproteobacteria bacterium]